MTEVAINDPLALIPSVCVTEQGSDPANPGAGYAQVYVKAGVLYVRSNTGVWTPLANPLTTAGSLVVGGVAGALTELTPGDDEDVLTIDPATHVPAWIPPSVPEAAASAWSRLFHSELGAPGIIDTNGTDLSGYDDLVIKGSLRGTGAYTSDQLAITVNNDTTDGSYLSAYTYATASATNKGGGANRGGGSMDAASATAGAFASIVIDVIGYAKTDRHKTFISKAGDSGLIWFQTLRWLNTAAITRLAFAEIGDVNLAAGSYVDIWGVKNPSA